MSWSFANSTKFQLTLSTSTSVKAGTYSVCFRLSSVLPYITAGSVALGSVSSVSPNLMMSGTTTTVQVKGSALPTSMSFAVAPSCTVSTIQPVAGVTVTSSRMSSSSYSLNISASSQTVASVYRICAKVSGSSSYATAGELSIGACICERLAARYFSFLCRTVFLTHLCCIPCVILFVWCFLFPASVGNLPSTVSVQAPSTVSAAVSGVGLVSPAAIIVAATSCSSPSATAPAALSRTSAKGTLVSSSSIQVSITADAGVVGGEYRVCMRLTNALPYKDIGAVDIGELPFMFRSA